MAKRIPKKWLAVIQGYEQAVVFAEIHKEKNPGEFTIIIENNKRGYDRVILFPHEHTCDTLEKAKEKVRKFFENYLRGLKGKPWKAWSWEER